ncbi:unnamed protein product [Sphagnum jensenii]|uniref:Uncharacterized protein n=1 Tax=Sphagnum jensenii TaxID=128206 RepID=A0ABP0XGH1_9BRYO
MERALSGFCPTSPGSERFFISGRPSLLQLCMQQAVGCSWLNDLSFLPGLKSLECLILRDCWYLPGESISCIQELPHLQCLDLENVTSITDKLAAYYLPGLKELRALNVSGTGVGDGLVEALTYGSRLHAWVVTESTSGSLRKKQPPQSTGDWNEVLEQLLQQWPSSHLTYLRLQHTLITQASISHLLAIPDLVLLDVRGTNVTGRSIFPIQVKHRLVALPNNSKLAAHTNAMLARVLEGECGCKAMALQNASVAVYHMSNELLFVPWDQAAIQLLQNASLESSPWV